MVQIKHDFNPELVVHSLFSHVQFDAQFEGSQRSGCWRTGWISDMAETFHQLSSS